MTNAPVLSITNELISELEALASKATPGPWWIDSHGHNMVSQALDHQLVFTADDRMKEAERNKETGNLSHWPNDWDASFIAAANPATILALLAERAELLRDAMRYRWIRQQEAEQGIAVLNVSGWERAATCWAITYPDAEILDAAIDTAMQQDATP